MPRNILHKSTTLSLSNNPPSQSSKAIADHQVRLHVPMAHLPTSQSTRSRDSIPSRRISRRRPTQVPLQGSSTSTRCIRSRCRLQALGFLRQVGRSCLRRKCHTAPARCSRPIKRNCLKQWCRSTTTVGMCPRRCLTLIIPPSSGRSYCRSLSSLYLCVGASGHVRQPEAVRLSKLQWKEGTLRVPVKYPSVDVDVIMLLCHYVFYTCTIPCLFTPWALSTFHLHSMAALFLQNGKFQLRLALVMASEPLAR